MTEINLDFSDLLYKNSFNNAVSLGVKPKVIYDYFKRKDLVLNY